MEMEWQTMDTAPTDGTSILICTKQGKVAIAYQSVALHWNGYTPVYWMPLPKPKYPKTLAGIFAYCDEEDWRWLLANLGNGILGSYWRTVLLGLKDHLNQIEK